MRRALPLGILAAGGLLLAGCAGVDQDAIAAEALACPEDSECYDVPEPIGPGGSFSIEAGDLFFQNLVGVPIDGPNEVTISNIGAAEHNIRIDQAAGENKLVTALGGETNTGTLQLFAGTYTYYCDIPGHRSAGMEGTITVLTEEEAEDVDAPGPDSPAEDNAVEGEDLTDDPESTDAEATDAEATEAEATDDETAADDA